MTIQWKRAIPNQSCPAPVSWGDEAEGTKTEATIPLVPGRNQDFVSQDDFGSGICKICVSFGITLEFVR